MNPSKTVGTYATSSDLTIAVPTTAHEVAALQERAEAELEAWGTFTIDTAEEYAAVDATLSDLVRRKDAAMAMRKTATGPLYKATKTIESWFAPYLGAITELEGRLKHEMGAYRLAQAVREREAREAAAVAADAGDEGTLMTALVVATEAAQPPDGRATVAFGWRVARVVDDLVQREWLVPDRARMDAYARAWHEEEPPVIAGVVFERAAKIGARR